MISNSFATIGIGLPCSIAELKLRKGTVILIKLKRNNSVKRKKGIDKKKRILIRLGKLRHFAT